MQNIDLLTWFGYLASVVTAISLLMSRPLKLRWLNLAGSALFAVYGVLIGAYPVGVFNGLIVLIDAYYIVQIYSSTSSFRTLLVENHSQVLQVFVKEFGEDINLSFPRFKNEFNTNNFFALQLRDMEVAGIIAGKIINGDELEIAVDYTSPRNRDYKPGKYFFKNSNVLKEQGIKKVWAKAYTPAHESYLNKMGFIRDGEKYSLTVA